MKMLLEKVIEKLAITDRITLVCETLKDGKIRVNSSPWADAEVILKSEVLEVRNLDGGCGWPGNPGNTTRATRRSRLTTLMGQPIIETHSDAE